MINITKTKVIAKCKVCNCDTYVIKAVISGNLPVYCSDNCRKLRYEHFCESCGKTFRSSKSQTRTCSRICQTELRRNKKIKVQCYHCKLEFERATSDIYDGKRIFCSKKCNANQHSLDNPSRYGTNWSTMRKRALIRDNHECTICKSTEKLEVHHIIKLNTFIKPNDTNYIENLKTVCKRCHKQIELKDIV